MASKRTHNNESNDAASSNDGASSNKKEKTEPAPEGVPQNKIDENGLSVEFSKSTISGGKFHVEGTVTETPGTDLTFGTDDVNLPGGAGDVEQGQVTISHPSTDDLARVAAASLLASKTTGSNFPSNSAGVQKAGGGDDETLESRPADDYTLYFSKVLQMSEVIKGTDGVTFTVGGPTCKIERVGVRVGGGAVHFLFHSDNKQNKLRIEPPRDTKLSLVSWKKTKSYVTVICK